MFAFKARDIELYVSNDSEKYFFITRLICSDCKKEFYTDLLECYFCGEINYYLFTCTKCGKYSSITGSSRVCRKCYPKKTKEEKSTLQLSCTNKTCISNTDTTIQEFVSTKDGVFKRNNGLNVSCTFCINCSSPNHEYKSYRVFLYDEPDFINDEYENFKKQNSESGDLVILKKHSSGKIEYDYQVIGGNYTPGSFDKDLDQIVEEILA
jgi:hypothetical protein